MKVTKKIQVIKYLGYVITSVTMKPCEYFVKAKATLKTTNQWNYFGWCSDWVESLNEIERGGYFGYANAYRF